MYKTRDIVLKYIKFYLFVEKLKYDYTIVFFMKFLREMSVPLNIDHSSELNDMPGCMQVLFHGNDLQMIHCFHGDTSLCDVFFREGGRCFYSDDMFMYPRGPWGYLLCHYFSDEVISTQLCGGRCCHRQGMRWAEGIRFYRDLVRVESGGFLFSPAVSLPMRSDEYRRNSLGNSLVLSRASFKYYDKYIYLKNNYIWNSCSVIGTEGKTWFVQ